MSHFSVIVVGNNVEAQLAPYHEFECTGENDQYVVDTDVTAEVQKEGLDYYGLEEKQVRSESEVDRADKHKFGYAIVDAEGHLIKAVRRTNPNKKWDWYEMGGRWTGFFKLKPGCKGETGRPGLLTSPAIAGTCDSARKGDIDLEGMRAEAEAEALALYDKAYALIGDQKWRSWHDVRSEYVNNIDTARDAYNSQPAVRALKKLDEFSWDGPDGLLVSREEYGARARASATAPYAIVKNGQWQARGEMGWFGMSNDDMSRFDWGRKVSEEIDALPDDTLLTIVDCHI